MIPLWPGDGTRADDPAKNLVESMPDKGDNILRIQNVTKPTLHLWKPTKQNGGAVINPLRSGPRAASRPSRQKQFPSSQFEVFLR